MTALEFGDGVDVCEFGIEEFAVTVRVIVNVTVTEDVVCLGEELVR